MKLLSELPEEDLARLENELKKIAGMDVDSIKELVEAGAFDLAVEINDLENLKGCDLFVQPKKIMCKYASEPLSDKYPIEATEESCSAFLAEEAENMGCDFDKEGGDVDVDAHKAFVEKYEPDNYERLMSIGIDWNHYFNEKEYATVADYASTMDNILTSESEHGVSLAASLMALVGAIAILN